MTTTLPVFLGLGATPALNQLEVGQMGQLSGSEAAHAIRVKRLAVRECLDLVDGKGLRVTVKITAASKERGDVHFSFIVERICQEEVAKPALGIVQALAKNGRDEQAVESAVELDAQLIWPWAAQRCIVQWNSKKQQSGWRKWQDVATAAAKQSRRSNWPTVEPMISTAELVELVRAGKQRGIFFILLDGGAESGLQSAYNECEGASAIVVIVGPEGGVADSEIEQLVAAGAKLARLGKTVLRSSSAGPASLAVLGALSGNWH